MSIDKNYILNKELIVGNKVQEYQKKLGLFERPKVDEIFVNDNESRALLQYVTKYVKAKSKHKREISQREQEKKIKEILSIVRGDFQGDSKSKGDFSKRSLSMSNQTDAIKTFRATRNLNFAPSTDDFQQELMNTSYPLFNSPSNSQSVFFS